MTKHINKIAELVDENYHGEAMAYAARHVLKNEQLAAAFDGIEAASLEFGYLTDDLAVTRDLLTARLKVQLTTSGNAAVWGAF